MLTKDYRADGPRHQNTPKSAATCGPSNCHNCQRIRVRSGAMLQDEELLPLKEKSLTMRAALNSLCICIFLIGLATTRGLGQELQTSHAHPKLGLVLEGGGALGLAHIGVIQYLEEHRIPVSYVAGTSMGGLVGGVYATGRDAAEVRELVESINWDEVISGQTAYNDLSFRRKQDAREYPSGLEFGLRKGVQFPSGFNSGQEVDLILDRVALPYSQLPSFDDLPIPFACVATDLVTKSEHVFRSGTLDLALRSTMSLPGIFTPVVHEGHVFVDGGLLNNIPVRVAKDMGADIVLGIHLETAALKPDASLSSFQVLGQSIETVIAVNGREAMKQADIMITIPLQHFTSMEYGRADAIIKAGYEAAAANAEKLSRLSVDEATWKAYLTKRDGRRRTPITPAFVEVTGVDPHIADPLAEQMSDLAEHPVDSAKVENEIQEVAGTGPYSSLNYSIVERNGKHGLQIEAQRKSYSPPIVRPLILIDGSDYNNVFFSVGARITFLDFGGYRRELRNDVIVGSQYGIASEYYRPFSPTSRWFVAPRIDVNSYQYPVYTGDTLLALYRNRLAVGGLDIGYSFWRVAELRLGYEGGYQSLRSQIGSVQELPKVSGATGDVRMQFQYTTLDDPVIPHSGESVTFYTKYYNENPGAPSGFPLSELQLQNFFQFTRRSTAFLNAFGGTSYGYNVGVPAFHLGGVTRFSAYGTNELLTNQYVLGQAGYIRKLKNLPPVLGSTIDLLGVFEIGQTYQLPFGPKPPHVPADVVGALVVNTIFGPVEVGGAVGDYGHG